jgi:GT2 family glycosyltransferase
MTKTYIVTPFKDEAEVTCRYLSLLKEEEFDVCFLYDNGSNQDTRNKVLSEISDNRIIYNEAVGVGIYEMWNRGWKLANSLGQPANIAFFNNDIEWDKPIVKIMAEKLRSQPGIGCVYLDYYENSEEKPLHSLTATEGTFKDRGMTGFAFMLRAEMAPFRVPYFDTRFSWWYGDDFIEMKIRKAGMQVARINGLKVKHEEQTTANNGHNEWTHNAKMRDFTLFIGEYASEYESLKSS